MKIKVFIFNMVILCMLYSCNKKENIETDIQEIKIASSLDVLYKKDIVESIKYIPLRASDDFLVQSFTDLFVEDSLIFVVDQFENTVFVYDFLGEPVTKIHSIGNGPGEYTNITNAFVDPSEHIVNIYDRNLSRINSYDYSGKFVKETLLKEKNIHNIIKQPNASLYITEMCDPDKEILNAFSDQQQLISKALSITNKKVYSPYLLCLRGSRFAAHNDTLYFISIFDYSIYSFKDGRFKKEYFFKMDENLKVSSIKSEENSDKQSIDIIKEYRNKGYMTNLFNFVVNDNYISFEIEINGNGFMNYNILYNRITHESYFYEDLYSDNTNGSLYQPSFISTYKDYFVFIVRSSMELEHIRKTQSIVLNDPETPIVCFVKLKK